MSISFGCHFRNGALIGIEKLIKNKTPGERLSEKQGTEWNQDKNIGTSGRLGKPIIFH